MDEKPDLQIEDAEIVTENKTPVASTLNQPAFDIQAFNATLEIVRRRLTILEKAKDQLKKLKEMYNDIFDNDPGFSEADKVVKEAMKKRKDVQAQLSKQPNAADLNAKLKDLKSQIKDNEDVLSQELMEYYKTAGVTEIETEDGSVQEFAIIVKLKSKKKAE